MKTAVVTGALGGIGSAIIEVFNREGWRTIGVDRTAAHGSSAASRLLQSDVSDPSQLEATVRELAAEARIDALINNAAIPMDRQFADISLSDWDATMNTNVRAAFVLTQSLLEPLAKAQGGVVNIASVHAIATTRGTAAYAASKGALVAFTRAVSLDLASSGVRCNAVCPGATDTAMLQAGLSRNADADAALANLIRRTPLGRIGTGREIAEAVLFLADSQRSGFITGQTLTVDGGATSQLSTE